MSHETANYPTARLKLAGGLCGIVALNDSAGRVFSTADWTTCLAEPETLQRDPQKVLKREGEDSVVVKTLHIGGSEINAVIKTRTERTFLLRFRQSKALHNFKKALILKNAGIAAEIPFAALWRQQGIFAEKSIYITEYVSQSENLHWFAKRDLATMSNQPAIKQNLARRLAEILAALHKNGLWHRDAKPSNILVRKSSDGRYEPMLIDLDGIKCYGGLRTFSRRFRPFAHLAVRRSVSPFVYTTDCLRTFAIYCNLTGVAKAKRKRLFWRLANGLAAKRIESLAAKGRA